MHLPRLILALLVLPTPALAELGGPASTVATDGTRMAARLSEETGGSYRRHVLTRPNGGTVHELSANGRVFAVTWDGPGKPDLRTLLGPHFAALTPAPGIGRAMHGLRRPVQVAQGDLRLVTEGHGGWFRGAALIPSLAPAGFDPADLAVKP